MRRGNTVGLWIAALVMVAITVALYFYEPRRNRELMPDDQRAQLEATIAKAATYYEFGHYERAVETYRSAIERGLTDAEHWYRFAHAIKLSGSIDLQAYATAYQLLLEQNTNSEYLAQAEKVLEENALPFRYTEAVSGDIPRKALVRLEGTVSRVIWGRIENNENTMILATRRDRWLGHVGDEVAVEVSRRLTFEIGDTVSVIGTYEGWCSKVLETESYPCIQSAGTRLMAP